ESARRQRPLSRPAIPATPLGLAQLLEIPESLRTRDAGKSAPALIHLPDTPICQVLRAHLSVTLPRFVLAIRAHRDTRGGAWRQAYTAIDRSQAHPHRADPCRAQGDRRLREPAEDLPPILWLRALSRRSAIDCARTQQVTLLDWTDRPTRVRAPHSHAGMR